MKTLSNVLKIVIVSLIQTTIMFLTYLPIGNIFVKLAPYIEPDLWFPNFYQNGYMCIIMLLVYLVVGIILFVVFKFMEVKLISKHNNTSYQYMLIPSVMLLIWEIVYNVFNIHGGDTIVLIWLPLNVIIIGINLLYEFVIIKKLNLKNKS